MSFINKYIVEPPEDFLQFSLFDKVNRLKQNPLFSAFPNPDIARIIENATDIRLQAGEELSPEEKAQDSILLVLTGKLSQFTKGQKGKELIEGESYWGIVHDGFDEVRLKAETSTTLLVLSPELIFNAMAENSEFTLEVIGILSKTA